MIDIVTNTVTAVAVAVAVVITNIDTIYHVIDHITIQGIRDTISALRVH
jgi:hypothetical protein